MFEFLFGGDARGEARAAVESIPDLVDCVATAVDANPRDVVIAGLVATLAWSTCAFDGALECVVLFIAARAAMSSSPDAQDGAVGLLERLGDPFTFTAASIALLMLIHSVSPRKGRQKNSSLRVPVAAFASCATYYILEMRALAPGPLTAAFAALAAVGILLPGAQSRRQPLPLSRACKLLISAPCPPKIA